MSGIKDLYDRQNRSRKEIRIDEWQKVIYVGPMTYGQYIAIQNAPPEEGGAGKNLALLERCAKNEAGEPAFNAEELHELRLYAAPVLITRVALAIVEAHEAFDEEFAEKKA